MDTYAIVTNNIIAELEKGICPWLKPWFGRDYAISHTTGKRYSVLNQMLLGKPGEYITFAQCKKEGGTVKKGAKGRPVVFWKFIDKKTTDETTEEVKIESIPFLQYYTVFHIDDCEGITSKFMDANAIHDVDPIASAEDTFNAYIEREHIGLNVGESAFYSPAHDAITLPELKRFVSAEAYYDTAFHEAIHSTGHKTRLDRLDCAVSFFGNEEYSKEELVAEIGSAMVMHRLGINTEATDKNNVAYIGNWLKALENDKRFVVGASSKAEKAVEFLFGDNDTAEAPEAV